MAIQMQGSPSAASYSGNQASPLSLLADPIGGIASSIVGAFSAQSNRDWQEQMANTAHQREVKDLKAAGLNPVLSALGGSGAQTPSGAVFTPDNPMRGFAQNYMAMRQQNAMQQAQLDAITQSNATAAASADNSRAQATLADNQNNVIDQTVKKLVQDTMISNATAKGIQLENQMKQKEVNFYSDNPFTFPIKSIMEMFGLRAGNLSNYLGRR